MGSFSLASCYIREKMMLINRLDGVEGFEVDAVVRLLARGQTRKYSFRLWLVVLYLLPHFPPVSCLKYPLPPLGLAPLSLCLNIAVDKCLEVSLIQLCCCPFLCLWFFLRALVGGGLVVCVGQDWGGMGFRVLSSAFQQYFPSHSHLRYLWQLHVSCEATKERSKYIWR